MQIKNPESVLGESIIGMDGELWQVWMVNKLWDLGNEPYIQFTLTKISNSKKSINAKLKIFETGYGKATIYELKLTSGESFRGYIEDINTKKGFIQRLSEMLPINL